MGQLYRFTKSVLDQPQLATPELMQSIAEYLDNRNIGAFDNASVSTPDSKAVIKNGVATLSIEGVLVDKPDLMSSLCGMTSYRQLLSDVDQLCSNPDVNTIVMSIDSGGGQAINCMNAARQLRAKTELADKKLVAYIDSTACSAAYALASSANEIIAHPDCSVGSIGCVVSLQHDNKRAEKEGVTRKFISSAEGKTPFDEDNEFRTEFLDNLQTKVDELANNFYQLVADMRQIPVASIKGMNAEVFSSTEAINRKLIDKVMTPEQFADYIKPAPVSTPKAAVKAESTPTSSLWADTIAARVEAMKAKTGSTAKPEPVEEPEPAPKKSLEQIVKEKLAQAEETPKEKEARVHAELRKALGKN